MSTNGSRLEQRGSARALSLLVVDVELVDAGVDEVLR